ncbi:MAG TPA: helix-turn-helix domain-containing protein [Ktedonosporobacter sp.]|nr:helix-turn-helix domain-containing protein [Ktedonosporobacter sp.]
MATLVTNPNTPPVQRSRWTFWKRGNKARSSKQLHEVPGAQQQVQADPVKASEMDFYEQAIERTHRADKVINLVLGYLLAVASVLGFMDVLSNGEVLGTVPYLFYVWLAIMGLGVDFQILLVIGRIPDLVQTIPNWRLRLVFLAFNIVFLAFLCYMSVVIAAVFTQHRDVPGTIAQAMQTLGIDSTSFVYERATLATLLLVLMAVDRTMERWRMQLGRSGEALARRAPVQVSEAPPQQTSPNDLEHLLQVMQTMNQQNLQTMAAIQQQSMQVTIEQVTRVTVDAMRDTLTALPIYQPPAQLQAPQGEQIDEREGMKQAYSLCSGEQQSLREGEQDSPYAMRIEALYKKNAAITITDIVNRLGCSRSTAAKWLKRVQAPEQEREASQ